MRRLLTVAMLLCLAGPGWGQDFVRFRPPVSPISAALGAEQAPAIAAANWTCGAGWDCSVAGTLNKNADGQGTAVPNPALTIVAGTTYKVVVTVGALTVGSSNCALGGTACTTLAAATTYTSYVTASSTANLTFTPGSTSSRFTITAVSVKALTDATGDLTVDGNLTVRSGSTFNAPILVPDGTAAAPVLARAAATNSGLFFDSLSTNFTIGGTNRARITSGSVLDLFSDSALIRFGSSSDVVLNRDAANTLALRNSTAAQAFNIYNTYTDTNNYERGFATWTLNANEFNVGTQSLGSGTLRNLGLMSQGVRVLILSNVAAYPATNDAIQLGATSLNFTTLFLSRSIQGFKTKTISDASATAFVRIALPQTVGSNFTSGSLLYHVHCDNGTATTYADRSGQVAFSCNNISGTEACVFDANVQTVTQAATYALAAPTWTATGGTDTVDLNVNVDCTGVVGPTNMYIHYRLDILDPQTITPQ